ncbi:MAG: glycoside hydrolase family 3 C-terminal domain-containing protein [Devosia nanyangense]|uniref:Beta-D-glucoside glucohydrolase n=1 Tax=Devosia nanyangense TaxID=1228055 RepID=A0A933L3R2_9HYPH|nr:glycoside hydrolase family 3 C-terminal domain-containing protein [Devosia nanyangense]
MSETRIHDLVEQMTLAEQVSLLSGEDFWSLPAIERLGIGKLRVTDGPNGARGGGSLVGGVKSAAFPVGIALGASWNVDLVKRIGSALADEVKSKGAHVSLAPTVNIHRSVTNGRNFECYSEDPVLTAQLAGAFIAGLQEQGVSATIKHFAGNESEIERTTIDSVVDERTLREVYLVPFEHAVKVAGTWGIMSSYNRLNGLFTSENSWLLSQVLRREWHYTGVVMSDWFGSHSTAPTVNAGLDIEMPGPPRDRGAKLIAAVEAGEVTADTVRQRVLNVLRLLQRTGALDDHRPGEEHADDWPEHRALIRRAGAEGAVLLKNDGLLPLDPKTQGKIAVIGPNAKVAQIMGGGSAQLNPHYAVSPWQGLVAAFGEDRLSFAPGATNHRFEPRLDGDYAVEFFNSSDLSGAVVKRDIHMIGEAFLFGDVTGGRTDPDAWSARYTTQFVPETSGAHRVGIVAAGYARVKIDGQLVADAWSDWQAGRTYFEEGSDEVVGSIDLEAGRSYRVELEFAKKPPRVLDFSAFRLGIGRPLGDAAIAEAVAAAKAADVAILCVGRTGEWDTEGSDLLDIKLPGRQDELIAAVAAANPRTVVVLQTGGPVEMPWLSDVAAVLEAWYPGQEAGNAITDVLTGAAEPGGRLPQSFPVKWNDNPTQSQDREVYPGLNGKVRYEEGVFIGYRHYDRQGIAPMFPFGFGLGYTSFALTDLAIEDADFDKHGNLTVWVTVTNTGERTGSEVVQLYVGDDASSVPRPKKELKAFTKVELSPGEPRRLRLDLSGRDFAFYSVEAKHWLLEPGGFTIMVGTSATAIAQSAQIGRTTTLMLPV